MTSTATSSNVSTWKRIKGQYLATAGAVALAASAVLTAGFSLDGSGGPATPSSAHAGISSTNVGPSPNFLYYLVDSQQEAAVLDKVIATEDASLASVDSTRIAVVVVDTAHAESLFSEAARELMQFGADFRIIDLRVRPTAPAPDESSVSDRNSKLDRDIMAGVISTERATWVFSDAAQ